MWYAEDGLHIAKGRTARYTENARVISWIEAAKRIEHLVLTGVFATTEELETAEIHERVFLAEQLWHLRGELTAQAKGQGILSVLSDYRKNGFPKDNERLSDKLKDSSFRGRLLAEYDVFLKAYEENRKILRFHYHDVYALRDKIVDLDLPRQGFHSEMKEFSAVQMFITEDEIEATLTRGSNVEGSKGRICRFLTEIHTAKEKVDFLRNEFGISGSSHAVSGYGWIYSDGKGLRLQKPACSALKLIWSDVSKRYENIIENDRYFTSEEKERYHKLLSESEGSK